MAGSPRVVKVLEVDEVDAEQMQVADEADQFLHVGDGRGLGFERLVPGDEGGDGFLGLAAENFADALERRVFPPRAPALAAIQASNAPSLACNAVQSASVSSALSPSSGLTALRLQRGDGGGMGGIDRALERQRLAGGDLRERKARDFARR